MSSNPLIDGYAYKVIARMGTSLQLAGIALESGEIGYTIDTKTFYVGDDTADEPAIPTTKSTGSFDFSSVTQFTFPTIAMKPNATVDGVDISKLNMANGFLVRRGNNAYGNVSIVSGNGSLQVLNPDGVNGNVDIRIAQSILDQLNSGSFLTTVNVTGPVTGDGTALDPLSVRQATTALTGVTRYATDAEAGAGVSTVTAITPYNLLHIAVNSNVALYITNIVEENIVINSDDTINGNGSNSSPLTVVQSTQTTRGATRYSTNAEFNAGANTISAITPSNLISIAPGSAVALAIASAIGISLPLDYSDIKMSGPGVLGLQAALTNQPATVIPFTTKANVITGSTPLDNNVVNQKTLKEFFPNGAVKTISAVSASLPAPGTVGEGAVAYDTTLNKVVLSTGTAWKPVGQIIAAYYRNVDPTFAAGAYNSTVSKGFASATIAGGFNTFVFSEVQPDADYIVLTATAWHPSSSDRDRWAVTTRTINGFGVSWIQDCVTSVIAIRM
jgi:hypothetical protein